MSELSSNSLLNTLANKINGYITSAVVLGGARFAFLREVTRSWVTVTRTLSVTRLIGFWPGTMLLMVPDEYREIECMVSTER
jgi:hypothetical protein